MNAFWLGVIWCDSCFAINGVFAKYKHWHNGTTHFFTFSLIIDGATEKILPFTMPLKSVFNRNFVFIKQKCIYEHFLRVKTIKRYIKLYYFCHKTLVLFASSELPPIGSCLHYLKICSSIDAFGIINHWHNLCFTIKYVWGIIYPKP